MNTQRRGSAGVAAGLAALACAAGCGAATLRLGPDLDLAQALRTAVDGDTIEIPSGDWRGQVGVITQRQLTLRGTGARPVLHAEGRHAEGKAILVVRGGEVLIENLEFRGTRVPDGNGAGIRHERGRLRLRHCAFNDNEMGLLTSNDADVELDIEDSEFGEAPRHPGLLHHLLYVGRIGRFSITGSTLSGGWRGHLLKSRAADSVVAHNRLVDGAGGEASYELEFPNGGVARVVGNQIQQSPLTQNMAIVAFGAEGGGPGPHALVMVHNTLVNDSPRPAEFIKLFRDRLQGPLALRLVDNRYTGPGRPPVESD